nr:DUF234 domain-containing protein [Helcococcus kunzii]
MYGEFVKEGLPNFMGESFEEISYEFLEYINKESKLPGYVLSYGRWCGINPIEKQEEEIDLRGEGRNFSIYGEFKWRNRDFEIKELEKLIYKNKFTPINQSNPYYLIITKKNFQTK